MTTSVKRLDQDASARPEDEVKALDVLGFPDAQGDAVVVLHPERSFEAWAQRWRTETQGLSSIARITRHPAYKQIAEMGWQAVPFILQRVEQGDRAPWWTALRWITGEDPVPAEDAGIIERMAQAWLAWGKERSRR